MTDTVWGGLLVLDLLGTLVFALSGAFRAVKHELDILGVLVLATFTGVGGGILRDLVIGETPPQVFRNEFYLLVCLAAGVLVFLAAPRIARRWPLVKLADALGLGVFAALGAWKGTEAGLGLLGVVMVGTLTAVGGGVIRDVLVREIPAVIRTDFYATAAALGSLVVWILHYLDWPQHWVLLLGIVLTTGTRLLAMKLNLNLPRARQLPAEPAQMARDFQKQKQQKTGGNKKEAPADEN